MRKVKKNDFSETEYLKAAKLVESFARTEPTEMEKLTFREKLRKEFGFPKVDFNQIYKQVNEEYEKEQAEARDIQEAEEKKSMLRGQKTSLSQIHKLLQQVTSSEGDLIEVVLAAIISIRVSEVNKLPMFWIFVVDVPSGDKTFHLMRFELVPFVVLRDDITSGSFGSGYVDPQHGKGLEKDFLDELEESCFICKDLSALFSKRPEKVKEFIGTMTNLYDQQFKKQTGTRGETGRDKCSFSHVAGITDEALNNHHRYIALLGPRYSMIRQAALSTKEEQDGFEILWNSRGNAERKEELTKLCSAYAFQVYEKEDEYFKEAKMDDKSKKYFETLSKLQAGIRGLAVQEDDFVGENDGYRFRIQKEKPFRALQQLRTIAISLARVHDRGNVTEHEKEILRKIVLSSGPNDRVKVLSLFRSKQITPKGRLTVNVCSGSIGKSYNGALRILSELEALNVLSKRQFECEDKSKDTYYWTPKPKYYDVITKPYERVDHRADLKNSALHKTNHQ